VSAVTRYPLCVADDATFWPWHAWPDFAAWPERGDTVVVVPVTGLADWGLGHALDAEETAAMAVLAEASRRRPPELRLLVAPPLRFAFGPDPGCAFAVDPPVFQALVAEVAASVVAAGFRRIVLFTSSPWNEEGCAAASRDLRIRHGAQIFRVTLAGLGLDFHPQRSPDRRRVQTLVTALTGREPEAAPVGPASGPAWGTEPVAPLPGPPVPLAAAAAEGEAILAETAEQLVSLLGEIRRRPAPSRPLQSDSP
jgi:creatinine amidohydrolase